MNPFRSVGARLGFGLAIVVAAALVLVHLIVVPSLKRNLIDAKLDRLSEAAPTVARDVLLSSSFDLADAMQTAAASVDARVVYFVPLTSDPPELIVHADSHPLTVADVQSDPIALRAFVRGETQTGTIKAGDKRFAEAAYPVAGQYIILLRASLHDTLESVDLVRRRLLIAGLIALVSALLVGYLAASVFARRIRRLERAADRIAGGDFGEPVTDRAKDELGQLAVTFERMRQRLAQLEHARREFIANASHELRTPLFSLGGFLELLADEELDPRTRAEFMGTMREQVDRLTKLATDLLDLSRLDAGRITVEREPVDLAALADLLVDEFRAVATSSGHDLAVDGDGEAPALGDEERALQIGRILVENALVHTPVGTPVRLRTARRNGAVLLTVEDEGPGIPAEHAGQIFDRFYRIEGSVASGSGLGLAIARELAELMGGSVELHLIPGRTIFALVLPTAMSERDIPHGNERLSEPSLQ
jgi:two-component system, OmpR family, sensor kinase